MTSAVRDRTRRAILDAAIAVLARNPGATLGEIATAATVGRTTLHRHFPERADLVAAVSEEGVARVHAAAERARMTEGTGASALRRLAQELFDLGDLLSLLFGEPTIIQDPSWVVAGTCDPEFLALVERGHRDGSIDPELPALWVQSVLWSQLYSGWSYLSDAGAGRHEVLRLILRTIDGAVTPRPPAG